MKRLLRALVVCKHQKNSPEAGVCHLLRTDRMVIKYSWKNTLMKGDLEGFDLVIAIGGDGTALSASHYLVDKPLLAVNSDPKHSEGSSHDSCC